MNGAGSYALIITEASGEWLFVNGVFNLGWCLPIDRQGAV
jgi:hypothetical protein